MGLGPAKLARTRRSALFRRLYEYDDPDDETLVIPTEASRLLCRQITHH